MKAQYKIPMGHHSNAEDVQSFDESALGQQPPKIGNPLAGHPARYTNPTAVGTPPLITADGTENLRADQKTEGPTTNLKPGAGVHTWPSKVAHYKEDAV